MKKRNLKSLKLNKNSISHLDHSDEIKGGSGSCLTLRFNTCGYCPSRIADCNSWWFACEPL